MELPQIFQLSEEEPGLWFAFRALLLALMFVSNKALEKWKVRRRKGLTHIGDAHMRVS